MNSNTVYIHKSECNRYPDKMNSFSPSIRYPEYKFYDEISKSENMVYDMIRQCLYHMGFDKYNFNTKKWNPLKELINPGDVVLIKPNMVLDENKIKENGTDCLITHPSLVRAILDYVVLALDGDGTIIVGDAPLQSCNFERLVQEQGYIDIMEFYKRKGVEIELVDFRNYKTIPKGGLLQRIPYESNNEAVIVDLKNKSEFSTLDASHFKRLRITNYDHTIMHEHHNCTKNEYSIAKKIIDADVIINMPKPKTHRKSGVTISLKNLVGINTNKEWLPHHTTGSVKEGGDEYLFKSLLKKKRTHYIEKRNIYMASGMEVKAKLYNNMINLATALTKIMNKDKYSEGSWFGNDTIWRTILDLNKIIFYADKHGIMSETKQRKMLIIGDMIISGEGEGPLLPSPKDLGIIAAGINPVCFDEAISTIMGFQPSLIPSINNARKIKYYSIADESETFITSNNSNYNLKRVNEISYNDSYKFLPSMGWRKHLNTEK